MIQLFTFRSFPSELLSMLENPENVFTFGKLHKDITEIQDRNPHPDTHFIGFALSRSSRQEKVAINKFNKGVIEPNGDTVRKLNLTNTPFELSARTTHTFCNWTMYKLSGNYKVSFFHIKREGWPQFVGFINDYLARV